VDLQARFVPSLRPCLARPRWIPLLATTSSKAKSGAQETSTSLRYENPRVGRKDDLNLEVPLLDELAYAACGDR
jgi:hypothetical protein